LALIRWRKLVWNIAFNGTTVVMNATTNELLKCPQTRQLLKELMLEVIQAAGACGKPLDENLAEEHLILTDTFPPYKPSMMLDYENRRPMEIRYIYDNPIAEAARYGFDMKKTQVIAAQLHFLQAQYGV
jgi:2-dehydropantoate 2-reductase